MQLGIFESVFSCFLGLITVALVLQQLNLVSVRTSRVLFVLFFISFAIAWRRSLSLWITGADLCHIFGVNSGNYR